MKLGFIGAGNMARAIINGLLNAKFVDSHEIFIHSAHKASYESYAEEKNLTACADNKEVVQNSDYVFLAIKPLVMKQVLVEIKNVVAEKKPVVISMVTGVSNEEILAALADQSIQVVRIMPNVNVEIGAGMTALAPNKNVTPANQAAVTKMFDAIGETMKLPERYFSTFVALAGSSPAFVYLFIDSLSRAGVKYGLTKAEATKIAAQAVMGSAEKVLKSDKTPWELVDDVCSPGGTTVAGLLAMEGAGFMNSVIKGVDATVAKDKE